MRAKELQSIRHLLQDGDNTVLLEVLDNPYPISDSTPLAVAVAQAIRDTYGNAVSGLHVYSRTDTSSPGFHRDVFVVLRHRGLWEVHHTNYDDPLRPLSGKIMGLRSGANPRFISTVLQLYLAKIGKGIRIVAAPQMMTTYLAVLSRILKRRGDQYTVSDVDRDYTGIDGKTYSSVVVTERMKSIAPALHTTVDQLQ